MQKSPFVVPTLDSKLIEEDFGLASGANSKISIVHMVAPHSGKSHFKYLNLINIRMLVKGKMNL